MTKPGMLIIVSGPSGVGKDTIVRRYLEQQEDCTLSISATTRPPRPGETEGEDYFFMSREGFGSLIARGDMLEYAEYNGNYYGTPKEAVNKQLAGGKNIILVIEVQGAMKIRDMHPDAVFVFIVPPTEKTLRKRLESRGTESAIVIASRMETARHEMEYAGQYDYIIVNDTIDQCLSRFRTVIAAAKYEARRMQDTIKEVLADA